MEMFGFWALSVFLVPDDDLVCLSQAVVAVRRRRTVRVANCGELRAAGFALLDTTRHPLHLSIVLAELTVATFDRAGPASATRCRIRATPRSICSWTRVSTRSGLATTTSTTTGTSSVLCATPDSASILRSASRSSSETVSRRRSGRR